MAKQPAKKEDRELTRKQHLRMRRDVQQTRRLVYGLVGVGALIVILIAAGVVQELVLKPRQPVAAVNGANISSQSFAKQVKFDWLQQSSQAQTPPDPQTVSQQTLDNMVDDQLVRQQAQQRGITVSQQDVDQAIEQSFGFQRTPPTATPTPSVSPTPTQTPSPTATPGPGTPTATVGPTVTPFPTATPVSLESYQSTYKQYLTTLQTQAGMTEADFRNLVETDLLRRKLYDAVTTDVPKNEEQVNARHILISIIPQPPTPTPAPTGQPTATPTTQPTPGGPTVTPTPAPRDDTQALTIAKDVKQKLDAGGDFAALAKQYSDDTGSKDSGGDLGWFGKGQMVAEFEAAAFGLNPGQISDPVKSSFGYHIIQVIEKDPRHPIDDYTLQQNQYTAWTTWLSTTRSNAKITKNLTPDLIPALPGAATTAGR